MKKKSPTRKKVPAKKKAAKAGKTKRVAYTPTPKHAKGMHDAHEVVQERRYEVRTLVSKVTFAALSFNADGFAAPGYTFSVDISGLLVDVSKGGCSLVFMKANPLAAKLAQEARCIVQINPDPPRLASIRWIKDLDSRLVNAGLAFV